MGNTSITDEISYTNLTAGEEYTLVGEIMDKSTGEKLNIEGSSAEKTFTPESSDGMVEMLYNIDSTDVAGREIVVFEDLFLDGKLIATHRDLNDENQTVSFPAISTKKQEIITVRKQLPTVKISQLSTGFHILI